VGRKTAEKLARYGVTTMGQLARMSLSSEQVLYKLFGVNAELLIDHAWGWEPCRISDIKAYHPKSSSVSSGQVLNYPYPTDKAYIVVREMAETMALDLMSKKLLTKQIQLTIGYDLDSLRNEEIRHLYTGEIISDYYGRQVPIHAHGSINMQHATCLAIEIVQNTCKLYQEIINPNLLVRRINITATNLISQNEPLSTKNKDAIQLDLFADNDLPETFTTQNTERAEKEKRLMQASLDIHKRYGKNALLKGINFDSVSTGRERNEQIGGHKK
jgi:DNA polymerase V